MTDPTGYAPTGPLETTPQGGFAKPDERRKAFTAALVGVELGDYDRRIIEWLCELDDPTCRTLVSLIWRARQTARTGGNGQ